MRKIDPSKLVCVVDCHARTHWVQRDRYEAGDDRLDCYYRGGNRIKDSDWRIKPAMILRNSIASVAVRLRKNCGLDDRINRRFRKCGAATAAMF